MALRDNFPIWLITCSLVVAAGCGDPDAGDADIDADVMDDADLRADAEVVEDDADLDDEGDGGYDGDVHHDADVESDADEFVDADADEDHEVAPPAASIGPEGGEVSLPDGRAR